MEDDETGQSQRATYEMWRRVHRRRAFFLIGIEPVRMDLVDDGTWAMARGRRHGDQTRSAGELCLEHVLLGPAFRQ